MSAALHYPSIKRILLWGSFISSKSEPNDLDYSLIVGADHKRAMIRREHEPVLVPKMARLLYGVDPNYVVIEDYPLESYLMKMEFIP